MPAARRRAHSPGGRRARPGTSPGSTRIWPRRGPKDDLKRRIEDASRFVDVGQLALSPQCGFSSTKEGNDLTHDQQWAKLALIAETAQEVWDST